MESRPPDDHLRPAEDTPDAYSTVNSHIEFSPDAELGSPSDEGKMERGEERVHDLAGRTRERAREARHRASDAAARARDRAGEAMDRAQERLQESGTLGIVRDNPLAALGIAVGIGFLLAGSSEGDMDSRVSRTRQQLKGAVVGSLSAVLAREARAFMGLE